MVEDPKRVMADTLTSVLKAWRSRSPNRLKTKD